MEEVIRFRLAVNQLDRKEFNMFLRKVGEDQIISLMVKGFLFTHQHSQKQTHPTANNANNIISNIIESREINKTNENALDNKSFKINKLPNVLIRQCASYLNAIDYFNFSKCDGLIYIASNSPVSLQALDMTANGYPNNLNKFRLLKTIRLDPSMFNKKYNNSSVVLKNINHLQLDMNLSNNHSDIITFMNIKCIDCTKITALTILNFGWYDELYDVHLFCEFLNRFVNVSCLTINTIYFDQFTDRNNVILPQLKTFKFYSGCINANVFRDEIIETHSKQIVHLNYDEGTSVLNSNCIQSLKLKELMVSDLNIDILSQLVKQSSQLERLFINWTDTEANDSNDQIIKNIITLLYTKYSKLTEIQLCMDYEQLAEIIAWTEIALSNKECVEHNYLKIMYEIYYNDNQISMHQIKLYLTQIVNALISCLTKHFMIVFRLYGKMDTIDLNKKKELVNKLKKKNCLVFEEIGADYEGMYQQIIISNKECIINGYQELIDF